MLIDTHLHLDLMENMQRLIKSLSVEKDIGVIAVGTTPKAYGKELEFCEGTSNIRVGLGMHPQLIAERSKEMEVFLPLVRKAKYIGEVGLDFNSAYISSKDVQVSVFREISKVCASEGNKVLSIHSVKAAGVVLDELETAGTFDSCTCIFHWFTGTKKERQRAVEDGALFSINHRMLRTKSGQELIKNIPINRILLETDAPFTCEIKETKNLCDILQKTIFGIEKIKGECVEDIVEKNALSIFGYMDMVAD